MNIRYLLQNIETIQSPGQFISRCPLSLEDQKKLSLSLSLTHSIVSVYVQDPSLVSHW